MRVFISLCQHEVWVIYYKNAGTTGTKSETRIHDVLKSRKYILAYIYIGIPENHENEISTPVEFWLLASLTRFNRRN